MLYLANKRVRILFGSNCYRNDHFEQRRVADKVTRAL
ncbi:hypothetical protein D918_01298 [Trichuris suis]|nr:hypothetical protein D918_01298 [Trichuris suis]